MKKSIIAAGAASIALAAMPIVGVFADDDQSATDTIKVTVSPSCTFTAGGDNDEYVGTGTNAAGTIELKNDETTPTNVHSFTVFCNKNSGYTVSATASELTQSGVSDKFVYKATLPSGVDGAWHATFAGTGVATQLPDSAIPQGGGDAVATATIVSRSEASATGGETFTATYTAYIGTETPAGTYQGTIAYTLAPGA